MPLRDRPPTTSLTRTAPSPSAQGSLVLQTAPSLRPPDPQALLKTDTEHKFLSRPSAFVRVWPCDLPIGSGEPAPHVWPSRRLPRLSGLLPVTLPQQRAFPRAMPTVPLLRILLAQTLRESVRNHIVGNGRSEER